MFVPEEVRTSVVFVGYKNPDGTYKLAGTAFFLTRIIGMTGAFLRSVAGARGFVIQLQQSVVG